MSIAGGYYKAIEAAARLRMETCQVFTKNNNQWQGKPITAEDERQFREAIERGRIQHTLSHSSYLINLAAPELELWRKSVDALLIELLRADQLGIPYVVVHPGAYTTSSEEAGVRRIGEAIDEIHRQLGECRCRLLLETTAGQGSCLGWRFEQLRAMLDAVNDPDRLGICLDTCHVFAAGYPLSTQAEYEATMAEFDRILGVERLRAFHLNDSQRELGSRVDRHAHIGDGHLGKDAFRWLLNDPRFCEIPMYLETPKEDDTGRDWDRLNLRRLRQLVAKRQPGL